MAPVPQAETLQDIIDGLKTRGGPEFQSISEVLSLVAKARVQAAAPSQKEKPSSDCPEDVEDCSEVVSPCCNIPVSTVFGTLPLKVRCKQCGAEYLLGALMRDHLKQRKTTTAV